MKTILRIVGLLTVALGVLLGHSVVKEVGGLSALSFNLETDQGEFSLMLVYSVFASVFSGFGFIVWSFSDSLTRPRFSSLSERYKFYAIWSTGFGLVCVSLVLNFLMTLTLSFGFWIFLAMWAGYQSIHLAYFYDCRDGGGADACRRRIAKVLYYYRAGNGLRNRLFAKYSFIPSLAFMMLVAGLQTDGVIGQALSVLLFTLLGVYWAFLYLYLLLGESGEYEFARTC